MKPHDIIIRPDPDRPSDSGLMFGPKTQILIDGNELKYCQSLKFEIDRESFGVVTVQLVANVQIEGKAMVDIKTPTDPIWKKRLSHVVGKLQEIVEKHQWKTDFDMPEYFTTTSEELFITNDLEVYDHEETPKDLFGEGSYKKFVEAK